MKNLDIRLLVKDSGITYREIAEHLDITQEWLSRLMAKKLSDKNHARILKAIEEIRNGRKE